MRFVLTSNGRIRSRPIPHFYSLIGQELVARGHRVLTLIDGESPEELQPNVGVEFVPWPSRRPTTVADLRFGLQQIRAFGADCVVANGFAPTSACLTAAWMARVPARLVWYHTLSAQHALDRPKGRLLEAPRRWRRWLLLRLATGFVANSQASKVDLCSTFRIPPARVGVLPYCIEDTGCPKGSSDRQGLISVGRLVPSKGHDVLLDAFAIYSRDRPGARLTIVGSGPARDQLEQQALRLRLGDRCAFLGSLPNSEVVRLMSLNRITVVPSKSEALGIVAIESLSVGTPVVASDVGGLPEVLGQPPAGILVPPKDPAALAQAVIALEAPDVWTVLSERASRRFRETFAVESALPGVCDWLEATAQKALREARRRDP